MARKKMKPQAKTKKTAVKKPTKTTTTFALAETMEKDFRSAPTKLATQYRKDLVTLKQQEQKLKNELKKAQLQKKISQKKLSALSSKTTSKSTATAKKQLITAKKAQDNLNKDITLLTTQLSNMNKHRKTLTEKQQKFTAINKIITQMEKEWANKKNVAAKSPARKTSKKATKKIKPITTSFIKEEAPPISPELPRSISVNETVEMN